MDVDGWDLDAVGRIVRQAPAAAGLPDPRLPEPHRQPDGQRPARAVRRAAAADRTRSRSSTSRTRPLAPRRPADAAAVRRRSPPTRSPSAAPARASGAGCGSAGSAVPRTLLERLVGGARGARPGLARSRAAGRRAPARPPRGAVGGRSRARLRAQRDALAAAYSARELPGLAVPAAPRAGCRCGASCRPTVGAGRDRARRRGRASRRGRLARAGVRRRRRPRLLRPGPLHPARRTSCATRRRPARRRLGAVSERTVEPTASARRADAA